MLGRTNSAGSTPNLIEKNIYDNGTYVAEDDNADGYSQVVVALPLDEKSITSNGEYLASADDLKGFTKVTVNVPAPTPALGTKSITANGTYNAGSDNLDGYSQVIVNVTDATKPTLNRPSQTSGTTSLPPTISNPATNGNFATGVIVTCGGNSASMSGVTISNDKFLVWETFEVLPIAGGTSQTLSYVLTGNNFNSSTSRTSIWTYPSATETSGYMSVTGLGNSAPDSQTYTYDSNFPRAFPMVKDIYNNKFIKIPTIYRSVTVTDGQITGYKLATTQIDSSYEPYPCFVDETNSNAILPYILIGKWCISSTSTANSVNATSSSMSIGQARTLCRNRGTGYQQFDWKIRQLFTDLGVALSRIININNNWKIYGVLGIYNQEQYIWVDGIIQGSNEYTDAWYFADKEADYYSPAGTTETEATILSNNYHKLSYSASSANGWIAKLGYDSSHPFENYPNETGGSQTTYYCDQFYQSSGARPVLCVLGDASANSGWWRCDASNGVWSSAYSARLCYRPILGATGYVEIDPVLANNSWATIKQVCQDGQASNYWALGDTKDIPVTINGNVENIPHAIVDMTANRYEYASDNTKFSNVVFQAVPTIADDAFNSPSNTNVNGAYATWYTSDLRTSMNSGTIYGMYDNSFTSLLEQVKTYEALDGTTNGDTVQYQADKLFLPAYQEVKNNPTTSYLQSAEKGLNIVEFGYYALNSDVNSNRVKYPYNSASATSWWLRSPYAGDSSNECIVNSNGSLNNYGAGIYNGVAPCFAW